MRNHRYHEPLDTHDMVLERRADSVCGDTIIHTMKKWYLLLADACQCQVLPDSNAGKLLVLCASRVFMLVSASQCQICATPTLL